MSPAFHRASAWMVGLLLCLPAGHAATPESSAFHFEVREGQNLNYFLRDGKTAAHLLLKAGAAPRLLVAFPAGNSGVGLWFEHPAAPLSDWVLESAPTATVRRDSAGRPLYGITFQVSSAARSLKPKQSVLSSVR